MMLIGRLKDRWWTAQWSIIEADADSNEDADWSVDGRPDADVPNDVDRPGWYVIDAEGRCQWCWLEVDIDASSMSMMDWSLADAWWSM